MKLSNIGMATVLTLMTGCPSDGGEEQEPDSASTSATSNSGSNGTGDSTTGENTTDDSTTGDSTTGENTTGDSTTDDDSTTTTGADDGLAEWPQPYQDFIAEVGGSNFVDVGGVLMHYVDTGPADGETVLLLHGIPTQTYLWRDVIPELGGKRVIAIDLIGYGRSERPDDLPYTPAMQVDFVQAFVEELALDEINLVVHDLGGPVGLRWAFEHPDRVASISMFETLWTTLPGIESVPPPFGELLAALRLPGVGEDLVGEQNVFLSMLGAFTVGGVSREDVEVYQFPWPDAEDRVNVFLPSGPRAFPVPEDPESLAFVEQYQQFLSESPIPKLVLDIDPGTLSAIEIPGPDGMDVRLADYAEQVFPNTTIVRLEGAGHFVQEDLPAELGQTINAFIDDQGQ